MKANDKIYFYPFRFSPSSLTYTKNIARDGEKYIKYFSIPLQLSGKKSTASSFTTLNPTLHLFI